MFNRKHGTRHNPIKITAKEGEFYCGGLTLLKGSSSIEYADSGVVKLQMSGLVEIFNWTDDPPHLEDQGVVFDLFPGG